MGIFMLAAIELRERPGVPWQLWANRQGTRAEIEQSARWRLEEMREAGYRRAHVRIDGRMLRA
jgi:hypothetical protein